MKQSADPGQQTLFGSGSGDLSRPLASRLRPQNLEEFVGQQHLLGEGKILRQLIDQDQISSMIFWGPVYQFQRRHQRHQRDQRGHAAGRAKPAVR